MRLKFLQLQHSNLKCNSTSKQINFKSCWTINKEIWQCESVYCLWGGWQKTAPDCPLTPFPFFNLHCSPPLSPGSPHVRMRGMRATKMKRRWMGPAELANRKFFFLFFYDFQDFSRFSQHLFWLCICSEQIIYSLIGHKLKFTLFKKWFYMTWIVAVLFNQSLEKIFIINNSLQCQSIVLTLCIVAIS